MNDQPPLQPQPTLVPFPKAAPLTDVAAQLRLLAEAIERGQYGEVKAVAVVLETTRSVPIEVNGYGSSDPVKSICLLQLGLQRLGQMLLVGSVARRT